MALFDKSVATHTMPLPSLDNIISQPFQLTSTRQLRFTELGESLQQQVARDFVTLLPDRGLLAISGDEAGRFLQGQLTCDINLLDGQLSTPGLHCTAQGRVIASFRACRAEPDRYALVASLDVIPLLNRSLSRYIVFSKASTSEHLNDHVVIGISGSSTNSIIAEHFGAVPSALNAQVNGPDGAFCTRISADPPRFEVYLPIRSADKLWKQLSQACQPADSAAWSLQDIRAGFASVDETSSEMFIPQMLDFDRTGALSFNKGCYTGQEIIARAHYRGTVKRRLHHFVCASAANPDFGESVMLGEKQVGTLFSWEQAERDTIEGLLVLQDGLDQPVHLSGSPDQAFLPRPSHPDKDPGPG